MQCEATEAVLDHALHQLGTPDPDVHDHGKGFYFSAPDTQPVCYMEQKSVH